MKSIQFLQENQEHVLLVACDKCENLLLAPIGILYAYASTKCLRIKLTNSEL